jgi:hypothetical protein
MNKYLNCCFKMWCIIHQDKNVLMNSYFEQVPLLEPLSKTKQVTRWMVKIVCISELHSWQERVRYGPIETYLFVGFSLSIPVTIVW